MIVIAATNTWYQFVKALPPNLELKKGKLILLYPNFNDLPLLNLLTKEDT